MGRGGARADVVIAHDFVETYGGAERIIATAAAVFPEAPFWAIAGRRAVAERMGVGDRFHTLLPESDALLSRYRLLAPAYPGLVRLRRLPACDVLLTSSYAFAHGFRARNGAPQVCYCYSPLRFIWSMPEEYGIRWARGRVRRAAYTAMVAAMRRADRRAAKGVTRYVSESRYVADQVRRFLGRESEVVYPPVDCELFRPSAAGGHDGYYLLCGRLVEPYKRPGLAIEAFRSLPHRLIVAGDGPAYRELKETAPENVELLGAVEDRQLVGLMQRCAGVIFPSVDDFGLIPVEAAACGRPTIAYAGGGALETVVPGITGELFEEQTAEALRQAVLNFDPDAYDPVAIRAHAKRFAAPRFQDEIRSIVSEVAEGWPSRDPG